MFHILVRETIGYLNTSDTFNAWHRMSVGPLPFVFVEFLFRTRMPTPHVALINSILKRNNLIFDIHLLGMVDS